MFKNKKRLLYIVLLSLFSVGACAKAKCKHDFKTLVSDTATCEHDGFKTFVCDDCGMESSSISPALQHDYHLLSENEATCTASGKQTYKCSRCSSIKESVSPALGHNYSKFVCTRCGKTDPDYLLQTMTSSFKFSKEYLLFDKLSEIADVYFTFECTSGSTKATLSVLGIIHASSWYRLNIYDMDANSLAGKTFVFSGYSSSVRTLKESVTLTHELKTGDNFYVHMSAGAL